MRGKDNKGLCASPPPITRQRMPSANAPTGPLPNHALRRCTPPLVPYAESAPLPSVSPQSSGARAGLHRKKKIYKVTSLHPPLTEHAQPFKFVRQTDMFLLDGAEGSIPASYAARASTS